MSLIIDMVCLSIFLALAIFRQAFPYMLIGGLCGILESPFACFFGVIVGLIFSLALQSEE